MQMKIKTWGITMWLIYCYNRYVPTGFAISVCYTPTVKCKENICTCYEDEDYLNAFSLLSKTKINEFNIWRKKVAYDEQKMSRVWW